MKFCCLSVYGFTWMLVDRVGPQSLLISLLVVCRRLWPLAWPGRADGDVMSGWPASGCDVTHRG